MDFSGPNAQRYQAWFRHTDKDGDGRVTGTDAKSLFPRAGLSQKELAKVWALSDQDRRGYLDEKTFVKAMELITLAQEGLTVSDAAWQEARSAKGGVPPPRMVGLDDAVGSEATKGDNPFGAPDPPQQLSPSRGVFSRNATKKANKAPITSVIDGLKQIYFGKIRKLEEEFQFGRFYQPMLNQSDFDAKPSILLLGQYSTGKTTFIKFLLGRDYPGANIGPEPTTDRFTVVTHGYEDRRGGGADGVQVPGNTLVVSPDLPYQSLHHFGTGFLSRLEGAQCSSDLLEGISLVDTPGVLSGEKQRIDRAYDFVKVCAWFASRADLILLLFDPYKLDISDEFKSVITALKGQEDKVRVCLNKADAVEQQQLMRVYGALMWSLSKVMQTPEVCRVYVGSFNGGAPVRDDVNPAGVELFEREQSDLMADLDTIPKRACDRRINELVKRVRYLKVHLLIIRQLKKNMPAFFKEKAQTKLLENLHDHFGQIMQRHHLAKGDFPSAQVFANMMSNFNLSTFPKVTDKMLQTVDDALQVEIPKLVKQFSNPY